uniref:UPF3A regulator of nonsense mediated mRNA decay n=1 Tax=Latimeria chalumnae TaxID=7897 RepID=H3ACX3_LATCH
DPEYKKFLENYCADEEKINANPETLLGEIEAKTKELIAKRTTPLLEYIKNKKLEKQRKEAERQKKIAEKEIKIKILHLHFKKYVLHVCSLTSLKCASIILCYQTATLSEYRIGNIHIYNIHIMPQLLKKPEKGEDQILEKQKEKGEEADIEEGKWEKKTGSASTKSKQSENASTEGKEKSQNESDKEQRDQERRFHEKEQDRQRCREDDNRKPRAHYEFDKFMRRREEEVKWGKGFNQERGKKTSHSYMFPIEAVDKLGKEEKSEDMGSKRERIRNKDRPAMQLYQPGARSRTRLGSGSKQYDCSRRSSEDSGERKYDGDISPGAGSEKSEE